ncbi:bacteriocin-like protein [Chryseobacterium sp. FDAARGOS 1104]|uniref:Uncharacterized protein n=1 Tax=Chryseobacterium taihuense TaxID=1141221 RepID=A0A4U8WEM7_9FLAO|nr:Uncharacterised protein [Chryseobacterium taihuense]
MKNLKKLSRENLKNLNGGNRQNLCLDIRDVSSCHSDYYHCALYSNNCFPIQFCEQTLYCPW